jgi:hypothetical protein
MKNLITQGTAVLDWAELHQNELLVDWGLCQQHQQPVDIEPLL